MTTTPPTIPTSKFQRRRGCLEKLSYQYLWMADMAIRMRQEQDPELRLFSYECPFAFDSLDPHFHLTRTPQAKEIYPDVVSFPDYERNVSLQGLPSA